MREYDETTHANVHRGVYAIAEEATRRFEAARANVGRFIGAPDPAREVVFTKNATEALNLVAHSLGPHPPRPGRRGRADRDGAPRQHRPVAHAGRRAGHRAAVAARSTTTGGSSSTTSTACSTGPSCWPSPACPTCWARSTRWPNWPPRPTPPAPWWWPTPASRSPTCPPTWPPSGVDFLAFSAHKMLGPTGIGVLWGREELLGAHAAVPRRGGDDPRRPQGRVHPQRHPLAVRGRHPAHHRGHRARCRRRLPAGGRHGRRPGPRDRADRLRPRRPPGPVRRRHPDLRPARGRGPGRGHLVRLRGRPPPRRLPDPRRVRGVRAGRPPLRQAPDAAPRASTPPPGPRSPSTTTSTTSTPWSTPSTPPGGSSGEPPPGTLWTRVPTHPSDEGTPA